MSLCRIFLALLYMVAWCHSAQREMERGYLPVRSERGSPICDPCARKYVFILAAGRSGSTTLMSMLNRLPSFSVLYEHHPVLFAFGKMLKKARYIESKLLATPGDEHAAKDGVLTSVDFACWAQAWFDHHAYRPARFDGSANWDANESFVRGFKLIRVKTDEQMMQLKSLFPCARFIFNFRQDVTTFSLFKAEDDDDVLKAEKQWLMKWSTNENSWRSQTRRFPLEFFGDLKKWDDLFKWFGLPECHTRFVLHYHADKGFAEDNRADPIHCKGESMNGVVGSWSTDEWLDLDSKDKSLEVTPFHETSHPEPKYEKLDGILPVTLEYNSPICDPCERKYVFIITAGNSGSGTLMKMLNLLPHFEILSKRHPMVYVFGELMRIAALEPAKIGSPAKVETSLHEGRMTSVDFACWTQDWLHHHLSTDAFVQSETTGSERPWSTKNAGVRGFELRTASHDHTMAELKSLFPCARFVYTYRENLDEEYMSEDQGDLSYYQDEVLWMKKWSTRENPWQDQTWQFPLEQHEDVDYWNQFLQWLGLPKCHVNFVPDGSSNNGETLPIQCVGDGTLHNDGGMGRWSTQDWLRV